MEANDYDRLLHQIAYAAEAKAHGYDRERAFAALDDYLAAELADEAAHERYPEVAFFLQTDEDFAAIYQALRRHVQHYDPAAEVAGEVDLAALAAYVDGKVALNPNDLAHPLAAPSPPAAEEQAYLRQLLPYWQQHLPQRGGLFMDASSSDLPPLAIPACDERAWLDLVLDQDDDGAVVDGQVRPLQPELMQAPVRLYQITPQPEPMVRQVAATEVDRFGHFTLTGIAPGHYLLALVVDEEIVGTTWLNV